MLYGTTLIPNELLESVGQLANKSFAIRLQGILNLLKVLIKLGIRPLNIVKELFDGVGEGIDGIIALTIRIMPILPRHPKDPVDGLLQVGGAARGEVYWGAY
ncbi:6,7-dimethyl-8-ribityllumazine synthase [Babesia caballi]|uniref:6,7-dimethyl-8-ribityllumazine synthase n=1 Tax=Babesia caballi TaxID=5871 RepID=A0AAV4LPB2_BABCB|nr:6,7-dimethyl-8-ribityllumazine synthase [Babesia caballi]